MRSAVGVEPGYLIRVPRFECLGHQVRDFRVHAHDLPDGWNIRGLIGLTFLRQFNYDYDTAGGGAGPNWHSTAASRAQSMGVLERLPGRLHPGWQLGADQPGWQRLYSLPARANRAVPEIGLVTRPSCPRRESPPAVYPHCGRCE